MAAILAPSPAVLGWFANLLTSSISVRKTSVAARLAKRHISVRAEADPIGTQSCSTIYIIYFIYFLPVQTLLDPNDLHLTQEEIDPGFSFLLIPTSIAAIIFGSFAPPVFGQKEKELDPPLLAFGPFTPFAESVNGRAAMVGIVALIAVEAAKGSALF